MKENVIKLKTFELGLKTVRIYKKLQGERKEYVMSRQILKSGTSIGANVREADHAESKADFIHKMSIALKEASETDYWLDLLYHSSFLDEPDYQQLKLDIEEVL